MKNLWNRLSKNQKNVIKATGVTLIVVGGCLIAYKYHKKSISVAFSNGISKGLDMGSKLLSKSFENGFELGKSECKHRVSRILTYVNWSDPKVRKIFMNEGIDGIIDYAIRLKRFRGG